MQHGGGDAKQILSCLGLELWIVIWAQDLVLDLGRS